MRETMRGILGSPDGVEERHDLRRGNRAPRLGEFLRCPQIPYANRPGRGQTPAPCGLTAAAAATVPAPGALPLPSATAAVLGVAAGGRSVGPSLWRGLCVLSPGGRDAPRRAGPSRPL